MRTVASFVCLFVWGLSSHSRIFHSYGDITTMAAAITGEGLQILTNYARHLWPLSSEGSLACHIYCDTGHPFIMVIVRGPLTLTLIAEGLTVKLSLPVLTSQVCHGWDSSTQPSACGANALTHCATAAVPGFVAFVQLSNMSYKTLSTFTLNRQYCSHAVDGP